VTAAAPGSGTPTGSVTFLDGATTMGTVALSGGIASFQTKSLTVGSHSITAVYGGDPNFVTSTAAAINQVVQQDATKTKLSSSDKNAVFGEKVTFTATVTAAGPGSGTPTGTVTFLDGSKTLGKAAALNGSGTATFTTSGLGVGTHSITAVYSGDLNFTASSSSALKETVNQAKTTTTVVSSANPSHIGRQVTFTITVGAVAPGSGTPTGSVTITIDPPFMQTVFQPFVGTASFTMTFNLPGTHSITAVYSGDSNFLGSTSPTLVERITTSIGGGQGSSMASPVDQGLAALPNQVATSGNLARAASAPADPVDQAIAALPDEGTDASLIHDVAVEQVWPHGRRPSRVGNA
jgi:hypothetical protein